MTKYNCDICRGSGAIRLPIYRRAVVAFEAQETVAIDESSRQYPCPECSKAVPFARVGVLGAVHAIDTRITDPKYIEHVKRACVHSLIDEIINGGYVKVESGPPLDMRQEYRVTLGVVSPKQVASLEERIAERQIEIAQEVATESQFQINNWASYYGHAEILKRDAVRMVSDSIKTVLAKRAAWKVDPIVVVNKQK